MIRTDYSLPIIAACLAEFNGENLFHYLNKGYKIINGAANVVDYHGTIIHVCGAHTMKFQKAHLVKSLKRKSLATRKEESQIKSFAMRVFGRLINTESMGEALPIIKNMHIVFNSEEMTEQCKKALKFLEESVNTFRQKGAIEIGDWDFDDKEDDIDHCENHAFLPENANELSKAKGTLFQTHFERVRKSINISRQQRADNNPYHLPDYIDYIWHNLLPTISLWSRILLGSLQKHNKNINDQKLLSYVGKTIFDMSLTNSYAEEYFSIIKQNKRYVSLPVVEFIERHCTTVLGLRRQYVQTIQTSLCDSANVADIHVWTKKDIKKLNSVSGNAYKKASKIEEEDDRKSFGSMEEEWRPKFKVSSSPRVSGVYQESPNQPLHFSPPVSGKNKTKSTELSSSEKEIYMCYQSFRSSNYDLIAESMPDMDVDTELRRQWRSLSFREKMNVDTPVKQSKRRYCVCRRPYNRKTDPLMVQCNFCSE